MLTVVQAVGLNITGSRCKMTLNVSNLSIRVKQSSEEDSNKSIIPTGSSSQVVAGVPSGYNSLAQISQVEAKLDLILKKMQKLENKNQVLDEQLTAHKEAG